MTRDDEGREDLVDLGEAKVETKGAIGFYSDDVLKRETPGLAVE